MRLQLRQLRRGLIAGVESERGVGNVSIGVVRRSCLIVRCPMVMPVRSVTFGLDLNLMTLLCSICLRLVAIWDRFLFLYNTVNRSQ